MTFYAKYLSFSDPFAAHHEYMRQMMRSFSDPFGRDPFLSITDGGERTVDRRARTLVCLYLHSALEYLVSSYLCWFDLTQTCVSAT
uniref:Uncharacterized protein n=1 Tax=Bubo bubo TaxID=30461 RepID=A0A8C0EZS7_BUBBB